MVFYEMGDDNIDQSRQDDYCHTIQLYMDILEKHQEGYHAAMSFATVHKRGLWFRSCSLLAFCTLFLLLSSRSAFANTAAPRAPGGMHLPLETVPGRIRGIQGDQTTQYPAIPWLRLAYPTCGSGHLQGQTLIDTIQRYHDQGVRIMLTVCQPANTSDNFFDQTPLADAAQGGEDAVQCGNEEMKQNATVPFLYIPPAQFARWYDLCENNIHKVQPGIPVLIGSLDPHVGGIDYAPLVAQAHYLDQMQTAMNSSVHPGGNWNWHTQRVGLIDTWHNGYPKASDNSLYGLFVFWARQFNVNLNTGGLGDHLWVVEGTGCFVGCGIDASSPYQVAVSHVLTLITDVVTAKTYNVPFFFFSGRDFIDQDKKWPIGVLDIGGHKKPIRQDLPMGARKLYMNCSGNKAEVQSQLTLLGRLYADCSLPSNYVKILES